MGFFSVAQWPSRSPNVCHNILITLKMHPNHEDTAAESLTKVLSRQRARIKGSGVISTHVNKKNLKTDYNQCFPCALFCVILELAPQGDFVTATSHTRRPSPGVEGVFPREVAEPDA